VDRNVNDSFKFNQETEFIPILGLLESQLNSPADESDDDKPPRKPDLDRAASNIQGNHHPALLALLAGELSVSPEQIHDFELYDGLIFFLFLSLLTPSRIGHCMTPSLQL
jgi:aspartyl aminopeptidase